jgi:LuxR family transcriptional regulator, maltose regulon positive regulatory protein
MEPLPASKLRPPRPPRPAVARPRLDALLERSRGAGRATALVAPAGYGKTTLVATFVTRHSPDCAWLALDEGDDALLGRDADTGIAAWLGSALRQAGALTEAPRHPGVRGLALALEPSGWEGVLVVDDAHHLGPDASGALAAWVERAPANVHTVLLARQAGALPLARWLARGEATVLGSDVLRMTTQEGRALLADVLPDLAPELAERLTERVEGWPAGLHLGARSLAGRTDPADLIDRFTGTDRYVLAFLTEEVLLRLPDALHEAALLLALEPRLCASLVSALTGRLDGAAVLAELEAHEAFLERLDAVADDSAPWFRFTGFFRDLLAHRLTLARPDLVPTLRARSARWWAERRARDAAGATAPAHGTERPAPLEPLTAREHEVLALLVGGASTKAIAKALGVSPNTVKTHLRHVFEKLRVETRTAAASRARDLGLA